MQAETDAEKFSRQTKVFLNANVVTMDRNLPRAEAFVVREGRFVYVGTTEEAKNFASAQTESIDLEGATVVPGLTDCHVHLLDLTHSLLSLDLSSVSSARELVEAVGQRAKKAREGDWIVGSGWNETRWNESKLPQAHLLDTAVHSNPVFLSRIDGHAALVNSLALKIAQIDKDTPDPPGGKILKNSTTMEPMGILIDKACEMVREHIPEPSKEQKRCMLELELNELAGSGLTAVHDAWTTAELLELLSEIEVSGKLPLRIYGMLASNEDLLREAPRAKALSTTSGGWICAKAVKLFADGALGSRGALLKEPYSDDKANRGVAVLTKDEMLSMVRAAVKLGLQPAIHAIGDLANKIALDVYEQCNVDESIRHLRPRIEHTQLLLPSDVPRFARLGIIASVQPVHLMSDMAWIEERLGPDRLKNAFLWQSLLRSGARLISGSDCPVESPNPFLGMYAAVTRKNTDGKPENGWHWEECMTREQALRSYTLDAAYGSFEEHVRGSIRKGKLADFTVIDRDILSVAADKLPSTRVLVTFIEGHEIRGSTIH